METHHRVSRVQTGAGREQEGTSGWWSQSPQEQETGPSTWMSVKGIEIRPLSRQSGQQLQPNQLHVALWPSARSKGAPEREHRPSTRAGREDR